MRAKCFMVAILGSLIGIIVWLFYENRQPEHEREIERAQAFNLGVKLYPKHPGGFWEIPWWKSKEPICEESGQITVMTIAWEE